MKIMALDSFFTSQTGQMAKGDTAEVPDDIGKGLVDAGHAKQAGGKAAKAEADPENKAEAGAPLNKATGPTGTAKRASSSRAGQARGTRGSKR